MGNYCKTIKRVFDPRLTPPRVPGAVWTATYLNRNGSRVGGIAYGDGISHDEREKLLNKTLMRVWSMEQDGLL